MGGLVGIPGQGGVVVFAGRLGVEAEVERVFPAEREPCAGQGVVIQARGRVPPGRTGGATARKRHSRPRSCGDIAISR